MFELKPQRCPVSECNELLINWDPKTQRYTRRTKKSGPHVCKKTNTKMFGPENHWKSEMKSSLRPWVSRRPEEPEVILAASVGSSK
jgi:hypothetical protein